MFNYLMPLVLILLGVVAVTIYCLAMAVRDAMKRMGDMNKDLMILLGTRDVGPDVGRALVAASRRPKKEIPGVAKEAKKDEESKGYTVVVGGR